MAHASHHKKNERGNVLLVSLLLLLVMSLMGTGLYYAMSKESRMVDRGICEDENLLRGGNVPGRRHRMAGE